MGALLEVGLGTLGGYLGGLMGLSVGWLIAIYVEAAFMLPGLYRALRSHPPESGARTFPVDDTERFAPATEATPSTGVPGK